MNLNLIVVVILAFLVAGCSTAPQVNTAGPWLPDKGDGTYKNPIILRIILIRMLFGWAMIIISPLPALRAFRRCRFCIRAIW